MRGSYLIKERNFVITLLLLLCFNIAHFVHNGWFVYNNAEMERNPPAAGKVVYLLFKPAPLPLHAPEAYRVAIPYIGQLLVKALGVKDPSVVAAALDFVFAFCALFLFYRLAVDHLSLADSKTKRRLLAVAFFLVAVQFPIAWIVPWQRPETLPTTLFLAIALSCLTRARRGAIWSVLFLIAVACQGFVRADVPFVFGAAILSLSLFGKTLEEFGSRSFNLLMGVCTMLIAGGAQVYLQLVRYPHLTYWPGNDVIQLRANLHLHGLSNCIFALLPFLLLAGALIVKRIPLGAVEALIAASSVFYLLLWFTVGSVAEVRLYVPFLMALCVVAARTLSASFANDDLSAVE